MSNKHPSNRPLKQSNLAQLLTRQPLYTVADCMGAFVKIGKRRWVDANDLRIFTNRGLAQMLSDLSCCLVDGPLGISLTHPGDTEYAEVSDGAAVLEASAQ
jgi:hypothetical protein